jgi:lipid-A-disaccharide synthase
MATPQGTRAAQRIFIIAGEASGDLHGANLLRELRGIDPHLSVQAWGGDRIAAEGAEVKKHYRELAFMGFTQVIMNLRTILRNIRLCKEQILAFNPDALILIDYPGFNLRIADWAKQQGIRVFYYISPQLWAWKENRIAIVKRSVDRMFVILPFEKEWYAQRGVEVDFVGHPLMDEIASHGELPAVGQRAANAPIALLPGSRQQEIARMLPLMLATAKQFPAERFVVAAAPSIPNTFYTELTGDARVELVTGGTYDLLREAKAALVTSGTATLETALFGVPEVVCYSGGAINVWLARRLVKVKFISLVNLIMDREVVRELIQQDLTVEHMRDELRKLLLPGDHRDRLLVDLTALREKLGGPGASARTARLMWKSLHEAS